jgi:hypothetical protein
MYPIILDILSSVDFWKVVAPALIAIGTWYLNEKRKFYWEKWKLKKVACEEALDMADAVLSNYEYDGVPKDSILKDREGVNTIKARKIFNSLACFCENKEVLTIFKEILFGSVKPDIIVDLRNAIRKELNFGRKNIDDDREKAFIGKLGADQETK